MAFTAQHERLLLDLARRSIRHGLDHGRALAVTPGDHDAPLREVRASFVTLNIGRRLRGCVGALEASMPLVRDVAEHAWAAAFADRRFRPLEAWELYGVDVHISVLSPRAPVDYADEADLLARLRPGVDGLVIELDGRRATFLPAVWESLPEPRDFLARLKQKAGMPPDASGYRAWRYTAEAIPSH